MKTVLYSTSMALALASMAPGLAPAQQPGGASRGPAPTPVSSPLNRPFLQVPKGQGAGQPQAPTPGAAPSDEQVFKNGAVLPAPVDPGQVAPPSFLPSEPLEPYLLTTDAGPFMVAVHIFRGDYAVKKAQALAMELRAEHRLPAFVYFLKLKPGNSNIRDIPPTAERGVDRGYISPPESETVTDEAVVLVGNCPTIDEANDLRKTVKKIRPRTLADHSSIFPWRNGKGLERAFATTNPLLPAQDLYPGRPGHNASAPKLPPGAVVDPSLLRSSFTPKVDPEVVRWNKGTPNSIYKCPAPYSLVVAEFSGRSGLAAEVPKGFFGKIMDESPLKTAHEDAEKLAEQLSRHEVIRSLGVQPYVYHDRTSSRVLLGGYPTPDDPKIDQVRKAAMTIEVEAKREGNKIFLQHLAPAGVAFEIPKPE